MVRLFSDSEDFDGGRGKKRPFKPGTLEVPGLGVTSNKVSNQSAGALVINHTIGAEAKCFISRREVPSAEPLRTRWWTDMEENNRLGDDHFKIVLLSSALFGGGGD